MWEGNQNLHDSLEPEFLAKEFLRWPGFGTDSPGRHLLASLVYQYHRRTGLGDKPVRVLDVACGTAINYEVFRNLGVPVEYHGVDLTQKMIDVASSLYPEIADNLKVGSIYDLPYPDSSFDIVIARHIFEHIPKHRVALQQCFRVAKDLLIPVFFIEPIDYPEEIKKVESEAGDYFMNRYSRGELKGFFALNDAYRVREYPGVVADYLDKDKTTDTVWEAWKTGHGCETDSEFDDTCALLNKENKKRRIEALKKTIALECEAMGEPDLMHRIYGVW